jgi:hypothetical protein
VEDFDLSFRLSEGEFRDAHRTYLRTSLLNAKNLVLLTTALAIGAIQAQMFGGTDWALRIFGSLWLLVIGLMIWAYLVLPGRVFRKSDRFSSEQRLQTEDAGLTLEQAGKRIFITWREITRVTLGKDALLLHRRHEMPVLIPARAFRTPEDVVKFHERIARARMSEFQE